MQMQRLPLVGDHLFGGTTSKSKSFPGGESLKDSDASRWSAVTFFSDTTKLVLDSGGLLMEAATVREPVTRPRLNRVPLAPAPAPPVWD